eukprot:Skav234715  [mRNA]  locus=scaffold634:115257:118378:+ [translate_table: standard]
MDACAHAEGIYTPRGAVPPAEMHLLRIDADDSALANDHGVLDPFRAFEPDGGDTPGRRDLAMWPFVAATEERRGLVLTNPSFVKQLVRLAYREKLLE